MISRKYGLDVIEVEEWDIACKGFEFGTSLELTGERFDENVLWLDSFFNKERKYVYLVHVLLDTYDTGVTEYLKKKT